MSVEKAFSRSSESYSQTNYVQQDVAKRLVSIFKERKPKSIIDIGAGAGAIYLNIDWKLDNFLAIDFSKDMLKHHPLDFNITKQRADFDSTIFWRDIDFQKFDAIVSSSALQWSRDLQTIFQNLSQLDKPHYLSIFTDRTFNEIHRELNIKSPIYSKRDILKFTSKYSYEVLDYKLTFPSRLEALKYIKRSGVSGGEKRVQTKDIKSFIEKRGEFQLSLQVILLWK